MIQTLGTLTVFDPWLKKLRQAGIPVFSVDLPSTNVINTATSDKFSLGAQLALQLVSDINGRGNIVVFNGFAGVPVCEIRYNAATDRAEILPGREDHPARAAGRDPQHGAGRLWADLRAARQVSRAGLDRGDLVGLGHPAARRHAGADRGRAHGDPHLRVDGTPEVLALVKDRRRRRVPWRRSNPQ